MRRLAATRWGLLSLAVASGCDSSGASPDPSAATPDAGPLDAGDDAAGHLYRPAPPETPEPPRLPECLRGDDPPGCAELPRLGDWTCPSGWLPEPAFLDPSGAQDVPDGLSQVHVCVPPAPPRCPAGQRPALGRADCGPLGAACPAGPFPKPPPDVAGPRVHALAGAEGGDGSAAAPFGTLHAAVRNAPAGAVVLIGRGVYREAVELERDLTLVGACVEQTRLESQGPGDAAATVVVARGARGALHNVGIGGSRPGVRVEGEAHLEGVLVEQATGFGLVVAGGRVRVVGSVVRGTRLDDAGMAGVGLHVDAGGRVTLADVVFEEQRQAQIVVQGASAYGPSELMAEDVLIRDGLGLPGGEEGWGLAVAAGARATLARLLVERTRMAALSVTELGPDGETEIRLTDVVLRDTAAVPDVDSGFGLTVAGAHGAKARVVGRRLVVEGNAQGGIVVDGSGGPLGAEVELTDLLVRGRHAEASGGPGLWGRAGSRLRLSRALFEGSQGAQVRISGLGGVEQAELEASDLVARHATPSVADGVHGAGVRVFAGARVVLVRTLVEKNANTGVTVFGAWPETPSTLDATDLVVRETFCAGTPCLATGIGSMGAARVEIERGVVSGNELAGVLAVAHEAPFRPSLVGRELLIRDGRSVPEGFGGIGALVGEGGTLRLERCAVLYNRDVGVATGQFAMASAAPAAELELTDVVVSGTSSRQNPGRSGMGVAVHGGASARLERVAASGNRYAGFLLEGAPPLGRTQATLVDVAVERTTPGTAGDGGRGIQIVGDVEATLRRARLADNHEVGLLAMGLDDGGPRPEVVADDVTAVRTRSNRQARAGFGMAVQQAARVTASRVRLTGSHEAGLLVHGRQEGAGAWLDVRELTIEGTQRAECVDLPPEDPRGCREGGRQLGGGHGLVVVHEGEVTCAGFLFERNTGAGALVADRGLVRLADGSIRSNAVGVNATGPGAEGLAESEGVWIWGNALDWSGSPPELPDPTEVVVGGLMPGLPF